MKTCPACHTSNAPANKFCQQCGRAFAEIPADATVRWTGQRVAAVESPRWSVRVTDLFAAKERLVVGRAPDCDVRLDHPTVSRYHALLELRREGIRLRDLASVNGVSVAGPRVTEPVYVREGERVGIGPFLFTLQGGVVQAVDGSRSLRLEARDLEKVVTQPDGKPRKLLDAISLVVEPGEFVTLLGPSGSGKSTLMDALNGRRRATGGQVLANGEDFYRHFDSFRQSLGYVPQKDIVHTQLTVYRALHYTALLRLPPDTDRNELRARIEEVIAEMELGPHRDTLVANLSGGQIKRVSLGAELLARPCLLYIDEATSGLDAGTEARMMRLFRRLADEGRSLVCITHNVDNVGQCHLILVLARGKVVYYGPPADAPAYFGVDRVSEIYDRLTHKDLADWEKEFAASEFYREFVVKRLEAPGPETLQPPDHTLVGTRVAPPPPAQKGGSSSRSLSLSGQWPMLADHVRALTNRAMRWREWLTPIADAWHQFGVLTARYLELLAGDRKGLRLLVLQAPIVALFLLVGFAGKDFRATLLFPRKLEDSERRMLETLRDLDALLASDAKLTDEQSAALRKVKFRVQVAAVPVTLDGTTLFALARQVRRHQLDPAQKKALEEAEFTVEVDGKPTSFRGSEVMAAFRRMEESRVLDKLLAFDGPVVPEREDLNPRYTYTLLFILVVIVLWFGCNNAAKEIVKEEAIYGRERAVNLGIVPYLASKFLVLTVITSLHALVLMLVLYGTLEALAAWVPGHTAPSPTHQLDYLSLYGVLVLLSMCGVALGLLLSACVATPDRANSLLPYVLIPQMILGGGILMVRTGTVLYWVAAVLSPVYWAFRAVHLNSSQLPEGFPGHSDYPNDVWLPCEVLLLQTMVLVLLTAWFLRSKDAA